MPPPFPTAPEMSIAMLRYAAAATTPARVALAGAAGVGGRRRRGGAGAGAPRRHTARANPRPSGTFAPEWDKAELGVREPPPAPRVTSGSLEPDAAPATPQARNVRLDVGAACRRPPPPPSAAAPPRPSSDPPQRQHTLAALGCCSPPTLVCPPPTSRHCQHASCSNSTRWPGWPSRPGEASSSSQAPDAAPALVFPTTGVPCTGPTRRASSR